MHCGNEVASRCQLGGTGGAHEPIGGAAQLRTANSAVQVTSLACRQERPLLVGSCIREPLPSLPPPTTFVFFYNHSTRTTYPQAPGIAWPRAVHLVFARVRV